MRHSAAVIYKPELPCWAHAIVGLGANFLFFFYDARATHLLREVFHLRQPVLDA